MGKQASYKCVSCDIDTVVDSGPPMWETLRDQKEQKPISTKGFKKQCHRTGKIYEVQVPVFEDSQARSIFVSLRVGHETISAVFCSDCLSRVRGEFTSLWSRLEEFVGKSNEPESLESESSQEEMGDS